MAQSIFAAKATQFIDAVTPAYAPPEFWTLGVEFLGSSKAFGVVLALGQGQEVLAKVTRGLELAPRPIKHAESLQDRRELRCLLHLGAQIAGAGVRGLDFPGRIALGDL